MNIELTVPTNFMDEMIVMLWANEIFDRDRPDTIACKV